MSDADRRDDGDDAETGPAVEIADNTEAGRYELLHDGEVVGWVRYRPGGDGVLVIPHVEVIPALRGRGHSAPFLDEVLADVTRRGLKVVPTCGYAAGHIRSRPDLHHLLA
jgi:predicted GNAT family acetyltransferase